MLATIQPDWPSHMWMLMHHASSSGHVSPQEFTEELDGVAELAGAVSELFGAASELRGASAELAGASAELVSVASELAGAVSELVGSAMAESASAASLLSGSWFSGISTGLLLLETSSAWLDVAGPSVEAELPGSNWDEDSGSVKLLSAGSELAEVESSQAFSVKTAAMPNVAAMAVETFFFSIFIFFLLFKLPRPFFQRWIPC